MAMTGMRMRPLVPRRMMGSSWPDSKTICGAVWADTPLEGREAAAEGFGGLLDGQGAAGDHCGSR